MLEDPIQPINENTESGGDTQKTEGNPPFASMDIGKIDPKKDPSRTTAEKRKRERKPLSCFEICTIVLGSIGILVAAGTGFAIYWQDKIASATLIEIQKQYPQLEKSAGAADSAARTAQDTLTDNRKNFRSDERPYMWLGTQITTPQYDNATGQIVWNFTDRNYGKTPAKDLQKVSFMKLGDQPFVRSYGEKNGSSAGPPPGVDFVGTVFSRPTTREEFDRLFKIDGGIKIKAVLTYTDFSGTKYETGVCLSHQNRGAIGFCEGNYIK
jgi:hypothetical protein